MASENNSGPQVRGPQELGVDIRNPENREIIGHVGYNSKGILGEGETVYGRKDLDGEMVWAANPKNLPQYITIDPATGTIHLSVADEIYNSDDFKEHFDISLLEQFSKAYRSDPDYSLPYSYVNDEGETVEEELTIPEIIEKMSDALGGEKGYVAQYNALDGEGRQELAKIIGNTKANKLTVSQLRTAFDTSGDRIYLPDIVFSTMNFLAPLENLRDEYGTVSKEDFNKYYNLEKVGREDLTGLMALLNGTMAGANWENKEEIELETGEKMKNTGSASEMVKAFALKQYILENDPDGEWYRKVGVNAESFILNASEAVTGSLANILNIVETTSTFGQSHLVQNWSEGMHKSMDTFNEDQTLVDDSTATLAMLGYLGGIVLTAWAESKVAGAATAGITKGLDKVATVADTLSKQKDISAGARVIIKASTLAENISRATSIARTFMNKGGVLPFATSFLLDTMHDAFLYDFSTLRRVLEGSEDEDVREYWLSQLAQNSVFWVPHGLGKSIIKWTKGTDAYTKVNAFTTRWLNAKLADMYTIKRAAQDKLAGGKLTEKLVANIEDAKKRGKVRKYNASVNKLTQVNFNDLLNSARKELGQVELEVEGGKLTKESLDKFIEKSNEVRALNNALDAYNRGVRYNVRTMLGKIEDPATGKKIYLNPTLGKANDSTMDAYIKTAKKLSKKMGKTAEDSFYSQDAIDYWVGSYHAAIMNKFANAPGANSAKAADALEIIKSNLEDIRSRLDPEIISALEALVKPYTNFYNKLNEYGVAKKLLDSQKVESYENNPIWKRDGYMPIVVATEKTDLNDSLQYAATIEQDFEHFTFNVQEGQHYVDPEMVRQSRIDKMARAEINKDMYGAYAGLATDGGAVLEEKISGEQTAKVQRVQSAKKSFEKRVKMDIREFGKDSIIFHMVQENPLEKIVPLKPKKVRKLTDAEKKSAIVGLSLTDTRIALTSMGRLSGAKRSLTFGVTNTNFSGWYGELSDPVKKYFKKYQRGMGIKGGVSFDSLRKMIESGGDEFELGLQRAYLIGSKTFMGSDTLKGIVRNRKMGKEAFDQGVAVTKARGKMSAIKDINTDEIAEDFNLALDDAIENYVDGAIGKGDVLALAKALTNDEGGDDVVANYLVLDALRNNKEEAIKTIESRVEEMSGYGKLSARDAKTMKKAAVDMFNYKLDNAYGSALAAAKAISPNAVDTKALYREIRALDKKIKAAHKEVGDVDFDSDSSMIMYVNDDGQTAYAKVDPAFVSLYNFRYKYIPPDPGLGDKINALMSKTFRWGTTGVNLASTGNQWFRDFANALEVGGAYQTIKVLSDDLTEVYGKDIVDAIKQFDPYEYKQIQLVAKETGQSLEGAAVSRELARGAALSPASTEINLYKQMLKRTDRSPTIAEVQSRLQQIVDKYSPDDFLNGRRERYLRNRVYANSLHQAMSQGYTIQQARTFAEYSMNNATTNFGRKLYHLQSLADTTPYLSAAINGTKSFWRMWSLDPVGITGRITGGLIIPAMALTGASLIEEKDREVYMNIPEYDKADNLVFVMNGQATTIPIPQELSSLIAPWRQFVEYLYASNKNNFWELMMNDALGLSPIDLTGFSEIDMDRMIDDPTILDRMGRGFARVFSQVAPISIKSSYMVATGTDPYTGKRLNDPSYTYWDENTESFQTMDYSGNDFAKVVASWFGGDANAALIEKVVSGAIGSTGSNLLGELTALFTKGFGPAFDTTMSDLGEQIMKPVTVSQYDIANSVWKRAIRELTAEKQSIISSDKWKSISQELMWTTDESKRKKILAERQNLIDKFQNKVGDTVKRLASEYGGEYDRKKFAATINLLNFNSEAISQAGSLYASELAKENYYEGREEAIRTMERLGVKGTNDYSIFGYLTTGDDGTAIMKYTNPVAIMNMTNVWYSASDIDQANIKALLKQAGITRSEMFGEEYQAAAKKGKKALKQYKAAWNTKVVETLYDYMQEHNPTSETSNRETRELLQDYIFVDSQYKAEQYLNRIFGGSQ